MIKEDLSRVIQGHVFYQNQWMPIEKKVELETKRRKKIEDGFVYYQHEWITIEDKVSRVSSRSPTREEPKQTIINQTINRQVYNIHHHTDKRTIHKEHKHVHLDANSFADYVKSKNGAVSYSENPTLEEWHNQQAIEDGKTEQKNIPLKKTYLIEEKRTEKK